MKNVDGYFVTKDGCVFVDRSKSVIKNQFGEYERDFGIRELKGSLDSNGYLFVKAAGLPRRWVARLVAIAFVEKSDVSHNIVNHIDGNRLNNNVSNLEWTDQKGNMQHAVKMGLKTYDSISCENSPNAVYTEDVVAQVYRLAVSKSFSQQKIGEMFGMPQIVVSNIKTKKSWKKLTDKLDKDTH
jgi:predicted XRE-type DNA-binding protein